MSYKLSDVSSGEGTIIRIERKYEIKPKPSNMYHRLSLDEIAIMTRSPNSYTTYHEIIEDKPQKFYMDIDSVDGNVENIMSRILEHVVCWFDNVYDVKIEEQDIIITENIYENEMSFHLIIDNYALVNTREAKWFYHKVTSLMSVDLKEYIDKLYKRNQNFRIEGSSKIGKNMFNLRSYNLAPNTYKPLSGDRSSYESSLVGHIEHCLLLDQLAPEEELNTQPLLEGDGILEHLLLFFEVNKMDISAFKVTQQDNLIRLDRLKSSYCALCQRIHDSDGAIFTVTQNNAHYKCWRNTHPSVMQFVKEPSVNTSTFKSRVARKPF